MKLSKRLFFAALALIMVPAMAFSQADPATAYQGSVEFGYRHIWGDVYGRPDLPFTLSVFNSKLNEYGDLRNDFFIRNFRLRVEDILGTKNYVSFQTQSTLYKNQSYLATFGRYNRYKFQFRYDAIPHTYTNTARSPYTQTSPGVYSMPSILRNGLQAASSTGTAAQINNNLPSFVATQLVPGEGFLAPAIERKAGTGSASIDLTPDWNVALLISHEKQSGTRPIALIFNSSPSAGGSSSPGTVPNVQSPGTGVEVPEPISYVTNTVKAMTEYGKKDWGIQMGYFGSFFENKISSLLVDNPFATADVAVQLIPPGNGCTPTAPAVNCTVGAIPSRAQMDLYPDNQAHYLNIAGAYNLTRYLFLGADQPSYRAHIFSFTLQYHF